MEELLGKMADLLKEHDEKIDELKESMENDERFIIMESRIEILEANLLEARVKNETLIELVSLLRGDSDDKKAAEPLAFPILKMKVAPNPPATAPKKMVGDSMFPSGGTHFIGP